MLDHITEIPLPGRTLPSHVDAAIGRNGGVALPAFVAGEENSLVAATFCQLLRNAHLEPAGSPHVLLQAALPPILSLFGASGTGKTHLARGLVRHWQISRGNDTADYVTAQDFRRQFADAMDTEGVAAFRRRLRSHELLAIDELHRLPPDEYLLQELRYTLDAFEEGGGTILVTSTQPVTTLANVPPDLRGRFASGLMLQLAAPGPAARLRIIRHVSTALDRSLSEEAASRLAAGLRGTACDVVGALLELSADLPVGRTVSGEHAGRVLAARAARRPALREIIALVARYYRLPQKHLKSSSRKQSAVMARATAVYLARELTDESYDHIGKSLGGRDHTTIMHNYQKIERELQRDLATQQAVEDLRRMLLSH